MNQTRIKTYKEFLKQLPEPPQSGRCVYRGICGAYKLIPSIAYSGEPNPEVLLKRAVFAQEQFNNRYRENTALPPLSDYDLVFLARHYELYSPFMDFTTDDTVAIQFAAESDPRYPIHLWVLDNKGDSFKTKDSGIPTSHEIAIWQSIKTMGKGGTLLVGQHTQFIQSGKLISQPAATLCIPFDETYAGDLRLFVIEREDLPGIIKEIEAKNIKMNANLMVDKSDPLFAVTAEINAEVLKITA